MSSADEKTLPKVAHNGEPITWYVYDSDSVKGAVGVYRGVYGPEIVLPAREGVRQIGCVDLFYNAPKPWDLEESEPFVQLIVDEPGEGGRMAAQVQIFDKRVRVVVSFTGKESSDSDDDKWFEFTGVEDEGAEEPA